MSELKEVNMAENQLVVGSVKVIKDISGGGIDTIKTETAALSQSVINIQKTQENYWSDIAKDNVITPVEKKTLKKEFAQIEQTYTAVMQEAAKKSIQELQVFKDYTTSYNALYNYLYSTLKLFADMTTNTNLPSYNAFISKYEDYFAKEAAAQAAISGTASATVRTLLSLEESGTAGELAYYSGVLYRYVSGNWKVISANNYKGTYADSTPEATIGDYFLASGDFRQEGLILKVNGKILKVNGKAFGVNFAFTSGYIYEYTENGWRRIESRNDYRYLIATGDIILQNGEVHTGLATYVNNSVKKGTGNYLGILTEDPSSSSNNDYYLYNGTETTIRVKGTLYRYNESEDAWYALNADLPENYQFYMAALKSAQTVYDGPIGVFSTVMTNLLITQSAIIDKLQTAIVRLQNGGSIQSVNWQEGGGTLDEDGVISTTSTKGLAIDSAGNADMRGSTTIGGTLDTYDETTIHDDLKVEGTTDLGGDITISGSGKVTGSLQSSDYEFGGTGWNLPSTNGGTTFAQIRLLKTSGIHVVGSDISKTWAAERAYLTDCIIEGGAVKNNTFSGAASSFISALAAVVSRTYISKIWLRGILRYTYSEGQTKENITGLLLYATYESGTATVYFVNSEYSTTPSATAIETLSVTSSSSVYLAGVCL